MPDDSQGQRRRRACSLQEKRRLSQNRNFRDPKYRHPGIPRESILSEGTAEQAYAQALDFRSSFFCRFANSLDQRDFPSSELWHTPPENLKTCQLGLFAGTLRAVNETSPEPGPQGVRSPFEGMQSSLSRRNTKKTGKTMIVAVAIALVTVVISVFVFRSLANPLRTLKPFPTEEYYEHYQSLEGTRFKATLRAAGQIGWKKDLGRLVNFQVEPDGKPIVALLPPQFDSQTFESGETFDAEIRVEEGGLLKINYLAPR